MSKQVLQFIKYVMAPLEVGPEFAFNKKAGLMSDFTEENLKSKSEIRLSILELKMKFC